MSEHFNIPQVFVQGGTNAGWRKPYAGSAPLWKCSKCNAEVRGSWTTCPNNGCNEPRPY